jgi:hypothetical protein
MLINRMALAATLVLGSATAVLAGGDDGKGRDGLWYSPAFANQAVGGRPAKVFNSYGRGEAVMQSAPSSAEMLWMKRASSSGRY